MFLNWIRLAFLTLRQAKPVGSALRSCFNFHVGLQVVTAISIYRRYVRVHSRCGAPGVALNAPKPDETPSGVRGNRDEAMTVRQHEPV
jgi:hypothetical protein